MKPRINRRNARFFGPGMDLDKGEEVEMGSFIGQNGGSGGEVRRPGRIKGGWREVMRVVTRSEKASDKRGRLRAW